MAKIKPEEDQIEITWKSVVDIANRKCRDTLLSKEEEDLIKENHIDTIEEFEAFKNL